MVKDPKQERCRGFDLGTKWANDFIKGEPDGVERVAMLSDTLKEQWAGLSAAVLYRLIAQAIDGSGAQLATSKQANDVWTYAVGEAADWPQSADFARGFAEGALDVWNNKQPHRQ